MAKASGSSCGSGEDQAERNRRIGPLWTPSSPGMPSHHRAGADGTERHCVRCGGVLCLILPKIRLPLFLREIGYRGNRGARAPKTISSSTQCGLCQRRNQSGWKSIFCSVRSAGIDRNPRNNTWGRCVRRRGRSGETMAGIRRAGELGAAGRWKAPVTPGCCGLSGWCRFN